MSRAQQAAIGHVIINVPQHWRCHRVICEPMSQSHASMLLVKTVAS